MSNHTHEYASHHRGHKHRSHPRPKTDASGTSSGIKDYGVYKGTPTSFDAQTLQQDSSPHIYLKFNDGSSTEKEAAINVASTDSDHRLVYWLHRTWSHPLTTTLTPLANGFTAGSTSASLRLDFLRTTPALLTLAEGRVLPNSASGTNNDILDQLEPILNDAISAKAAVYIFGSNYGTGIDDVHMNQGSGPQYDNAVGSDGALIFHYPTDGHWEAVFLAFASQEVPTNDTTGAAESGATALADIAKGTAASGASSS